MKKLPVNLPEECFYSTETGDLIHVDTLENLKFFL